MIRVVVAHDTSLLRSALAALLGREADFEVTDTGWPGLYASDRTPRPDVYVVDADCPGWRQHTGTSTGGRFALPGGTRQRGVRGRRPQSRSDRDCACGASVPPSLVVLTGAGRPGDLRRAYEARALGFVNKDRSADRLPTAVRRVAQGKRFVDESLAVEFLHAADMPLTRRELSVLSLSAEGASVTEIARSLHLCNGTVRNYLAAITRKTGARNRVDAIRISRVAGWV
ncbi:LuxR C-terminal-related transcriptional regulator [Streptomyces polygonati]|uniref:LuxR C-terminal-related transcriptional regulator n=1 Tax=Streptomyces polygonati TaxID=1617087 RepID=A0ABV8I3G0_9ACTN